ncbi:DUF551 domain-containing protein [Psychrobacter sp. JB193]|uniref:DUF551 domain-containing protein n=1 Tax=Psychrobacter sp. JB193 TaxID=2024406 RepID=UPI000BAAAFD6|nr:DUF551 domain-containing protein [Psychrobacter sp. JB193]PAT63972.1 hypothetical protein CIK80_02345 [Psychrobacter sp. JB193]
MNNLQPLKWDWSYGDGGKTNAVCRAKSPSHEYIIRLEAGGDCYVDYRKFDNDEDSDNRKDEPPVFDSVSAAQEWAQSTHYASKMQPYVKPMPTWIDASERLPESECFYLVRLFDGHRNEHVFVILWWNAEHQQFLEWDAMCEPTQWMPIPEFSTTQNNKGE